MSMPADLKAMEAQLAEMQVVAVEVKVKVAERAMEAEMEVRSLVVVEEAEACLQVPLGDTTVVEAWEGVV